MADTLENTNINADIDVAASSDDDFLSFGDDDLVSSESDISVSSNSSTASSNPRDILILAITIWVPRW